MNETTKDGIGYWDGRAGVSVLLGRTITAIEGMEKGSDAVVFTMDNGEQFTMAHQQDCCESVSLADVTGDPEDLIGSPVTMADESSEPGESNWGTATWTFYKFATVKGYVDLRWLGESNGYYGEDVDFFRSRRANQ